MALNDYTTSQAPVIEHSAIGVGVALTIVGYLPTIFGIIAAFIGMIFYLIQIKESKTWQQWRRVHKQRKQTRYLAKLRAKEKIAVARLEAIEKIRAARVQAHELIEHEMMEAAKLLAQEQTNTKSILPPIP